MGKQEGEAANLGIGRLETRNGRAAVGLLACLPACWLQLGTVNVCVGAGHSREGITKCYK